jgi:hypothetical protein
MNIQKFKYSQQLDTNMIIKLVVSSLFAWYLFDISSSDMGYIALRHEKIIVSTEFASLFYGFFAWVFISLFIKSIYELLVGIFKPKLIKVSSQGVLIPKSINSDITIMIDFNDIKSCTINKKNITINFKNEKMKIGAEFLQDEYEFNRLSSLIYTEYQQAKQADNNV